MKLLPLLLMTTLGSLAAAAAVEASAVGNEVSAERSITDLCDPVTESEELCDDPSYTSENVLPREEVEGKGRRVVTGADSDKDTLLV
ncbi:Protein of unknown function [Pyronema omphalodes CBS 100304]|uniref:Uncharacterized protein n=1 Tax=Pyronema omphalodes (strain CBS 100304) TaxID=1076935 RepID=U4L6T1_PYROM|nr:Protein of unknown function [Pyronema omphalodes CBS 100304]